MNKRTPEYMNTLLNQQPQRKLQKNTEQDSKILEPEQTITNKLQQIKKRNFQKLLTSDFTNSIGKIEFTKEEQTIKHDEYNACSLKDVVKQIQEKFIETTPNLVQRKNQEVPQFIRQRDQQKKEMMKIIQQNQESNDQNEKKNNYQIFFIEFVLILAIILMWKKIIENFQII